MLNSRTSSLRTMAKSSSCNWPGHRFNQPLDRLIADCSSYRNGFGVELTYKRELLCSQADGGEFFCLEVYGMEFDSRLVCDA